jgi:hypothetical protein
MVDCKQRQIHVPIQGNKETQPTDDGVASYQMQVRLLRDWVLSEDEKFRTGSVGVLDVYPRKDGKIPDMVVRFADWDAIGWEEGRSCIGYPGGAPVYDWGNAEDMESQFGPNLFTIEPLSDDTKRRFEDQNRIFKYILRSELERKAAVNRVWDKFAAYKKKKRKKNKNAKKK